MIRQREKEERDVREMRERGTERYRSRDRQTGRHTEM